MEHLLHYVWKHNCGQSPDGGTQLLDEALDGEGRTLGVILFDGDNIGAYW